MPCSWINIEYSIHRIQHTPSTASTQNCLSSLDSHYYELTLNVASASGVPPYKIDWHQPALHQSLKVKSPCHIRMGASYCQSLMNRVIAQSTPPIDRLQSRSIMASKSISKLPRLQPPSASPNSLNHGLQVRTTIVSKYISKLAWLRPTSGSLRSLDLGLQGRLQIQLITESNCISEFSRSWPPSASPDTLDHGIQLHLSVHSISASTCISKLAWSGPPIASLSSLDLGLQEHLQTCSIRTSKCISEFTWSSCSGAPGIPLKHRLQPVLIYRV